MHRPAGPVNWAGNVEFRAAEVRSPRTAAELQALVAGSTHARALGTGHSFSRIADTDGELISTAGLPPVADIDAAAGTVTVTAGVKYGDLAQRLTAAGWALPNLASLPHISVAGACATATHGSGDRNRNLPAAVRALELVTADGSLVALDRDTDPARFPGAAVGLGALGIVTTLTLDLVPAFAVRQYVYDDLPAGELIGHFDDIWAPPTASACSPGGQAAGTTRCGSSTGTATRRTSRRACPARPAHGPRHPVPGMPVATTTGQEGVPGPRHERLPHFRLGFTPSAGAELQTEYLLPRQAAIPAIEALTGLGALIAPVLQTSEIRTVAADQAWLSTAYHQDSVALHCTWILDPGAVRPVIAAVEEVLVPLGARPHWGKVSGMTPQAVRACYPRWDDFRALARSLDLAGKFRNDFMDSYFPRKSS